MFAPATVGNMACGFDVLGFALERPGDTVHVEFGETPGVEIVSITGDNGRLPREAEHNAAGLAALAVLRVAGEKRRGLRMEVHKGLPLSSGLGGSAASSVGAAVAADALLGAGLSMSQLLACAGEGESGGAGAAHLDNAAPCLHGGICLVLPARDGLPDRVVELPVPQGLAVAVVHPWLELRTADARRILGDSVALADAVLQWGNTAGLVAALYQGDLELLGRTLVDRIAEPRRAALVPGFEEARGAALSAGALGGSLSGSGPSVFALCGDLDTATRAGQAMSDAFAERGTASDIHVSPVDPRGARVLGQGE